MGKLLKKIKSIYLNTDDKRKKQMASLSVLIILFVSTTIFMMYIRADTVSVTYTLGSSVCGRPSDTSTENTCASTSWYINTTSRYAFCIEPNKSTVEGTADYDLYDSLYTATVTSNSSNPGFLRHNRNSNNPLYVSISNPIDINKMLSILTYIYEYKTSKSSNDRMATQIIAWEFGSGGRTNFEEQPSGCTKTSCFYSIIKGSFGDVYTSYKNLLNLASNYKAETEKKVVTDKSLYKMNYSNNKYTTTDISISSDFTCSPSTEDKNLLTVTRTSETIKVSATTNFTGKKTITCTKNSKSSNLSAKYYLPHIGASTNQILVTADGAPTIYGEFEVEINSALVKVMKKDINGTNMDGVKFKFYKANTSTLITTITSNTKGTDITPGNYDIVEETSSGYIPMQSLKNVEIPAPDTRQYPNIYKDSSGVTIIDVTNIPYSFKIKKVDDLNKTLLGASFSLYKSDASTAMTFLQNSNGCWYPSSDSGSQSVLPTQGNDSQSGNIGGAIIGGSIVGTNGSIIEAGTLCFEKIDVTADYVLKESDVPENHKKANDISIKGNDIKNGLQNYTVTVVDDALKIKWYKENIETGDRINKAGFEVYYNGSKLKFDSIDTDKCYKINSSGSVSTLYTDTSINNGEICVRNVVAGGVYTIKETVVPKGFRKMPDFTITATSNTDATGIKQSKSEETPMFVYFDKLDHYNNDAALPNVKFKVYEKQGSNFTKIKLNAPTSTENCYTVARDANWNSVAGDDTNSVVTTKALTFTSKNEDGSTFTKTLKSGVCLKNVQSGVDYKFEEVEPLSGYAYIGDTNGNNYFILRTNDIGNDKTSGQNITSNLNGTGVATGEDIKIYNYPTKFEFEKKISDDLNNTDSTLTKLVDIAKFSIYKKGTNTKLKFIDKENGEYWYSENGTDTVTELHTTNRKFKIMYLPAAASGTTYEVKEVGYKLTDSEKQIVFNATGTWYNDDTIKGVPGYYYNSSPVDFIVTRYSTGKTGSTSYSKKSMNNNLVTIKFNKSDEERYYNFIPDVDESEIESNKYLLDTAEFILRDKDGNILNLKKLDNGKYQYLPVDSNNSVTNISTYKGSLTISHLLNDTTYYIEEVKTTNPEEFILPTNVPEMENKPKNWEWKGHPYVTYKIKSEDPNNTQDASITQLVENVPTRVRIEKRDLKYGTLIKDSEEKAKFELYRVNKDGTQTKIYVVDRVDVDADGNVEYAYRYSKKNAKTDTEIRLRNGYIVFRYLPAGKYVLEEVEAPRGYDLPVGDAALTYFDVSDETINAEVETINNKPTKLIIKKYNTDDGTYLKGVKFKVYKIAGEEYYEDGIKKVRSKYDDNISEKANVELYGELLKFKTIQDGSYEYKEIKDTELITTCEKNCSEIGSKTNDAGIISEGQLLIEYLETGYDYVIEEVEAPKGYKLPDNPFKLVHMPEGDNVIYTQEEIVNDYTPISFFKYDEYNNLLDGAEYKLQKLNQDKKYEDITVSKMDEKEGSYYIIDFNTDNKTITTTNGSATIYLLTEGQYRIVETKAPVGYTLPEASINVATFFVTEKGEVKGDFIITNKKPTTPNVKLNKADAEIVLGIQTGKEMYRFSIIFAVLCLLITTLMIINRSMKNE